MLRRDRVVPQGDDGGRGCRGCEGFTRLRIVTRGYRQLRTRVSDGARGGTIAPDRVVFAGLPGAGEREGVILPADGTHNGWG